MKKVLIAIDYNPTAQKVAEKGYALANAMDAEVILLHVVADAVYYSSAQYSPIMGYTGMPITNIDVMPIDETSIENEAKKFLINSKNHLGGNAIQTLVVKGDCAESILKTAKELQADIIVLGSHSKRWLEKVLMGSITESVLHKTDIPLFIVPTREQ